MLPFDPLSCPLRGLVFIEASAGTGKTHSITSLVLRLLLEGNLDPARILLVTYTNAATDELRRKMRARLRQALDQLNALPAQPSDELIRGLIEQDRVAPKRAAENVRHALLRFDEISILTIHGFCQRVLAQRAFESGSPFRQEFTPDQTRLIEEAILDFWRARLPHLGPLFHAYLAEQRKTVAGLIPLAEALLRSRGAVVLPRPQSWPTKSLEDVIAPLLEETLQMLRARRGEIQAVIATSSINKQVYRSDHVANWLAEVEDMLSGVCPLPFASKHLARFTNSALSEATRPPEAAPSHPFFSLCEKLQAKARALEECLRNAWTQLKRDLLDHLQEVMPRQKALKGTLSYDDLLREVQLALEEPESCLAQLIAEEYQAILIDEFQDTDPIQYKLFSKIAEHPSHRLLCLIGDPKQAIYGFRGGDVFTYTHARDRADFVATLLENWRSTPALITALNRLFGQAADPFLSTAIQFHEVSPPSSGGNTGMLHGLDNNPAPLQILAVQTDATKKENLREACSKAVAQEIAKLIASGQTGKIRWDDRPIQPSDLAVLTRSHFEADLIQRALLHLGVKSVTYERHQVFQTREAEAFGMLLKALAFPRQESALKSVLLGRYYGMSHQELHQLWENDQDWADTCERFHRAHGRWQRLGFVAMFREFLAHENIPSRVLALPQGERILTNTLHLAELVEEAQGRLRMTPAATVAWFHGESHQHGTEERELRLESDDDRVKILTVHRSKGLEFPIVFVPFAWSAPGQHGSSEFVSCHEEDEGAWHRFLDLGSPNMEARQAKARRERAAEEMRLLYVALTRARHRLYLTWSIAKDYSRSSLAHLLHIREMDREKPLAEVEKRLEMLGNGSAARADIQRLVGAAEGTIQLNSWMENRSAPPAATESLSVTRARRFMGSIDRAWTISSYSSLIDHENSSELPDHDLDIAPPGIENSSSDCPMNALPLGTEIGIVLHEIYEQVDFAGDSSSFTPIVRDRLAAHGLSVGHVDLITRHLADLAELDLGGFRFSRIPLSRQMRELPFVFPTRHLPEGKLAEFFLAHGLLQKQPTFQPRPVEGFVKGFVDLVLESEGLYYIVDYKSNYLGPHFRDYHQDRLGLAMEQSGYVLQAYLYAVALHRFLQYRLGKQYSPETHFGGVRYLFVRGISPALGGQFGVCSFRPNVGVLEELSQLFRP